MKLLGENHQTGTVVLELSVEESVALHNFCFAVLRAIDGDLYLKYGGEMPSLPFSVLNRLAHEMQVVPLFESDAKLGMEFEIVRTVRVASPKKASTPDRETVPTWAGEGDL